MPQPNAVRFDAGRRVRFEILAGPLDAHVAQLEASVRARAQAAGSTVHLLQNTIRAGAPLPADPARRARCHLVTLVVDADGADGLAAGLGLRLPAGAFGMDPLTNLLATGEPLLDASRRTGPRRHPFDVWI